MESDSPVVPSKNLELAEVVKQLSDLGNALVNPPASNVELLLLLEEFELLLSGIIQKPEDVVLLALGPSKEALIGNQLLRHADTDVQITVLCCINEITRISAPYWPYEDGKMKEFFLVLVQSLEGLSSMNNTCYAKVISILYSLARVKSCVMMLDLRMEGSIVEMLQHFLASIQSRPSSDVFSDMVMMMTCIIEGCMTEEYKEEGVPLELVSFLLSNLKKDKKEVSPTSWALAEQILHESAKHIGPSLTKAVQSLGIDVNDYAQIVASICHGEAHVENMVDQELASDSAGPNGGLSKAVENNSTAQETTNIISSEQNHLKLLQLGNQAISVAENVNGKNAVPQENNDAVKFSEKRERKRNSLFGMEEGYFVPEMNDDIDSPRLSCGRKNYNQKSNPVSARKGKAVSFGSQSFPDENLHRKRTPKKKKGCMVNQDDPEQKVSLPSQMICTLPSRGKSANPANPANLANCDEESALETLSQSLPSRGKSANPANPANLANCDEESALETLSQFEASRMTYGEKLVGCKIKVWWPLDQQYYEGSIESFDLSTMMHKVIYDDGDIEILNLMGEDWQIVKDAMLFDGQEKVQDCSASSNPNSSVGPSIKKRKENDNGEDIPEVAGASMEPVAGAFMEQVAGASMEQVAGASTSMEQVEN